MSGKKRSLVFIPGLGYRGEVFGKVLQELSVDEFSRVAVLDIPSYGSRWQGNVLDFESYPLWLESYLRKRKINPPYTLVGHSLGGFIALKYAVSHRQEINKVIMISTPLIDYQNKRIPIIYKTYVYLGLHSGAARLFVKHLVKMLRKKVSYNLLLKTRFHDWAHMAVFLKDIDSKSVAVCIKDLFWCEDFRHDLEEVGDKVTLIYGTRDTFFKEVNGLGLSGLVNKVVPADSNHTVPVNDSKAIVRCLYAI